MFVYVRTAFVSLVACWLVVASVSWYDFSSCNCCLHYKSCWSPVEEQNTNEEQEFDSGNYVSLNVEVKTQVDRLRSLWHGPEKRKIIHQSSVSNNALFDCRLPSIIE